MREQQVGGIPPGQHIYPDTRREFENKVVDALSRCVMILVAMSAEVTGFERLGEEYKSYPDFGKICHVTNSSVQEMDEFILQDGYLLIFSVLCISPYVPEGLPFLRNTCWRSGWTLRPEQDG